MEDQLERDLRERVAVYRSAHDKDGTAVKMSEVLWEDITEHLISKMKGFLTLRTADPVYASKGHIWHMKMKIFRGRAPRTFSWENFVEKILTGITLPEPPLPDPVGPLVKYLAAPVANLDISDHSILTSKSLT